MKVTQSQLKQIIQEELGTLSEGGGYFGDTGGMVSGLGALRAGGEESPEDELDSQVQSRAMMFFMNLGLDEKVSAVLVRNIAIPDLQAVMDDVPKIDTAAEEEIGEALNIGGKKYTMDTPTLEDTAFKKLRNIMGLVEKAMLYMTGDQESGTNPIEVVEMIRQIVGEKG